MEHMQARHRLKQHSRARLGHLGLGFCDDNAVRLQKLEQLYADARGTWEAESMLFEPVITAACNASTTDNELQTIDTTLRNDRLFWSSTGSQTQIADEALLYELQGPACQVHFIRLAVYRAFYQQGYPVYPPMQLQVWAGPSERQLQPASRVFDVQATDALQTFALDSHAPAARFLQVRMYGKLQKQQEDMQFYIAIRHISAVGSVIPSSQLVNLRAVLRSGAWALCPGGQLPGSCCAGLRNMTGWGLGPWEGAAGGSAAGRILALPEQQQRQQQELEQTPGAVSQLVVRRQYQQQQNIKMGKRSHEHTKCQHKQPWKDAQKVDRRTIGGFLSSIGKGWRGSNTAAAARSCSAGFDMQVDADDTSPADTKGDIKVAAAAAAAAGACGGSTLPNWLWAGAAEDASSVQQQQHEIYVAMEVTSSGQRDSSSQRGNSMSSSESEQGYESDNDTDDQDIGQDRPQGAAAGGWAAAQNMAGAAEQARMGLMIWQALNRLPDPDDPVDREQVLAAWLEDEPLHSSIPAAFRPQMSCQQPTGASGAQQLPGGWVLHLQPTVECIFRRRGSSSGTTSSSSRSACHVASAADTAQQHWQQTDQFLGADRTVTTSVDLSAELVLPAAAVSHLVQLPAAYAAAAAPAREMQQSGTAGDTMINAGLRQSLHRSEGVRVPGRCLFTVTAGGLDSSSCGWQQNCSWFDEGQEQDLYLQQQLLVT